MPRYLHYCVKGSVAFQNPRADKNLRRYSSCSSQASQVFRRSGVCSFGLFQSNWCFAGSVQPFAEQIGSVSSVVTPSAYVVGGRRSKPPRKGRCRTATGGAIRHLTTSTGETRRRHGTLHERDLLRIPLGTTF